MSNWALPIVAVVAVFLLSLTVSPGGTAPRPGIPLMSSTPRGSGESLAGGPAPAPVAHTADAVPPRPHSHALPAENWFNLSSHVTGRPPGLAWYSSAYDPASNVVVFFGGRGAQGDRNYTWVYEPQGVWVNVTGPGPSIRGLSSIAWDPGDGYILLFGGFYAGTFFSDTWAWTGNGSGGSWQQLAVSGPTGRYSAVMVTDPAVNGTLLYGGCDPGACGATDTWEFAHGRWTELFPGGGSPGALHFAQGAYDPVLGRLVLFGGCLGGFGCLTPVNATWALSNNNWTRVTTGATAPGPRGGGMMFWDGTANAIGLSGGFGSPQVPSFNDTWELVGDSWVLQHPSNSPGTDGNDTVVWDPALSVDLLFLGESLVNHYPGATWAWASELTMTVHENRSTAPVGQPVGYSVVVSGGVPPIAVAWHSSGGTVGSGLTTNVSYSTPGTYNESVNVSDLGGETVHGQLTVTIFSTLSVSVAPVSVRTDVGESTEFAATVKDDGGTVTLSWEFGDGSVPASGANTTHAYSTPGLFHGTVTASDSLGGFAAASFNVTVEPDPAVVAAAAPTHATAGAAVAFAAVADLGVPPYRFSWSFGDGSTATSANASHAFDGIGEYTVRVTATDSLNQTANATLTVVVSGGLTAPSSSPPLLDALDWGLVAGIAGLATALLVVVLYRRTPKSPPTA